MIGQSNKNLIGHGNKNEWEMYGENSQRNRIKIDHSRKQKKSYKRHHHRWWTKRYSGGWVKPHVLKCFYVYSFGRIELFLLQRKQVNWCDRGQSWVLFLFICKFFVKTLNFMKWKSHFNTYPHFVHSRLKNAVLCSFPCTKATLFEFCHKTRNLLPPTKRKRRNKNNLREGFRTFCGEFTWFPPVFSASN